MVTIVKHIVCFRVSITNFATFRISEIKSMGQAKAMIDLVFIRRGYSAELHHAL